MRTRVSSATCSGATFHSSPRSSHNKQCCLSTRGENANFACTSLSPTLRLARSRVDFKSDPVWVCTHTSRGVCMHFGRTCPFCANCLPAFCWELVLPSCVCLAFLPRPVPLSRSTRYEQSHTQAPKQRVWFGIQRIQKKSSARSFVQGFCDSARGVHELHALPVC